MKSELQRIMYVEDEPDIRTIAEISLRDMGNFDTRVCASGEEALEVAVEFAPDLILLDVMMPQMDGPETLRRLREIPEIADTPIIFMTARIQRQEINDYLGFGSADVIPKPFDPVKLPQQLKTIWDRLLTGESPSIAQTT